MTRIVIYGDEHDIEEIAKALINYSQDEGYEISVGKARKWIRKLFVKQVAISMTRGGKDEEKDIGTIV